MIYTGVSETRIWVLMFNAKSLILLDKRWKESIVFFKHLLKENSLIGSRQ